MECTLRREAHCCGTELEVLVAARSFEKSVHCQFSVGLCCRRIIAKQPNGANRDTACDEEHLGTQN